MKKLFMFLIILAIIVPGLTLASPVTLVPQSTLQVGMDLKYLIEEKQGDDKLSICYAQFYKKTAKYGSKIKGDVFTSTNITYGLTPSINIFAKLGMVDGGKWSLTNLSWSLDNLAADLDNAFFWAIGAKGKVYEFSNGIGFTFSGQYLQYDNRMVNNWKWSNDGNMPVEKYGGSSYTEIDYWQVQFLGTAYWNLGRFTPYIGGGYVYGEYTLNGHWDKPKYPWQRRDLDANFHNKNRLSVIVGCDINIWQGRLFGNFQGSINDAVNAGLTYRF